MRERIAVAIFPLRKRTQEFRDSRSKVNWKAQDRAQLNHDRVHLPIAIGQINVQQRFSDSQMGRGTHWQKFCETFNNPQHYRKQIVVQ
jgi:hypothetical protein